MEEIGLVTPTPGLRRSYTFEPPYVPGINELNLGVNPNYKEAAHCIMITVKSLI